MFFLMKLFPKRKADDQNSSKSYLENRNITVSHRPFLFIRQGVSHNIRSDRSTDTPHTVQPAHMSAFVMKSNIIVKCCIDTSTAQPVSTGSIAHACADTRKPVKQGFFGIFEVFVDTIVICTLTALVILCSGVPVGYGDAAGAELTILGFTSTYGSWVSIFTAIAMCCFAFSTIIGWGLYGTRCVEFLLGTRANRPFMILYALVAIVGATMELGLMWNIAETFNGLMVIPNLIAVFLLSGVVVRLVKEYFDREGKNV